jgi:hypothetical protein
MLRAATLKQAPFPFYGDDMQPMQQVVVKWLLTHPYLLAMLLLGAHFCCRRKQGVRLPQSTASYRMVRAALRCMDARAMGLHDSRKVVTAGTSSHHDS